MTLVANDSVITRLLSLPHSDNKLQHRKTDTSYGAHANKNMMMTIVMMFIPGPKP